jgi:hypothetical protein
MLNYGDRALNSRSAVAISRLPFASNKSAYFGVDSVFRSGAPRPMKMGTIISPWRYDWLAGTSIRYPNIRYHSPVRYARFDSRP